MIQERSNFSDFRTTTDAVMIPDPGFVRQLRILDPELFVQWNWLLKRWEIWRKPRGKEPFFCLRIENQNKTFRQLGADILLKLQAGDPHRYSLNQLVQYFDAIDQHVKTTKQRDFVNKIEAIGKESRWYMAGLRVQVPRRFESIAYQIKSKPSNLSRIAEVVTNA